MIEPARRRSTTSRFSRIARNGERPLSRRAFLGAVPLLGAASWPAARALAGPRTDDTQRRVRYVGWQVGVTYQTSEPGGLTRDVLMRLLDEMALNRMNLLSLMMLSYAYFDPNHDGYCWPVRNPKLKSYWDDHSTNGQPSSEFVRRVIQAAADRGIEVQMFMNWGIWNPKRIAAGYPTAASQIDRETAAGGKKGTGWLHCPDSPGAWQAGLDEAADLLKFYNHPNVTSYGLERLGYGNLKQCFCPYTQARYRDDTGGSLMEADAEKIELWKRDRVSRALAEYSRHVRQVKPKTQFWLHTQCARGWGHDPARLAASGIDYLAPHTIQFAETRAQMHAKLRRLAPNPCVLHFCTRDQRPQNYRLWIKTPEIIAETMDAARTYPGDNLAGFLFFNPNATSLRNRRAVYEQIKRFHWPGA